MPIFLLSSSPSTSLTYLYPLPYRFFMQLDIVFHFNKVYALLDEYILAGEIQETSKVVILDRVRDLEKLE